MSGHSKWATTHRQKELTDAKKGAAFTKLANLIAIAAKEGGADLEANFKLRLAVEKARSSNMPKDNIERAIKRGTGGLAGATIEEVVYEIIGPAGSAFIAEAVTDNKNRTVSEIKSMLNKYGGQLGGPSSALWMFDRRGQIIADADSQIIKSDPDQAELNAIDAGADDIVKNESDWEIITLPENLQKTEQNLKNQGFTVKESGLVYLAKNPITPDNQENQEKIQKLYDALDSLDDISTLSVNL